MNYYIIPAALIISIFLTLLFSATFKSRGPFRGLAIFFLVIFLATWAGHLWITPMGPVFMGIAWLPLFFVAIIFAILMLAVSQHHSAGVKESREEKAMEEASVVAIGLFFWILLIALAVSIALGYWNRRIV